MTMNCSAQVFRERSNVKLQWHHFVYCSICYCSSCKELFLKIAFPCKLIVFVCTLVCPLSDVLELRKQPLNLSVYILIFGIVQSNHKLKQPIVTAFPLQALEYLLWSSISLELSIPLMTSEHLPWIVTLYCAVCHCYYDSQAGAKAEVKSACHLHPNPFRHTINVLSTDFSLESYIPTVTC